MASGKKEEAEALKVQVTKDAERLAQLEEEEARLQEEVMKRMMVIPNIIDDSVPIGKDDSENVEIKVYGEKFVPDFEVPYHTDIMEKLSGIDLDAARRVAGNGFYYLIGNIARLHSAHFIFFYLLFFFLGTTSSKEASLASSISKLTAPNSNSW